MTSAHRPTFDHAKGKDKKVSSAITHKRALPSHSRLKFRNKKARKNEDFLDDVDENKNEGSMHGRRIVGLEVGHVQELRKKIESSTQQEDNVNIENENTNNDNAKKQEDHTGDVDDASKDSEDREDSEDSEDSEDEDDEDDEEALLREMELIRKERAEAKKKTEEEILDRAKTSNPLINLDTKSGNPKNTTKKKSWRDVKTMSKKSDTKNSDRFSNDTLKSDFHKNFLDRYIK